MTDDWKEIVTESAEEFKLDGCGVRIGMQADRARR